MRLFKILHIPTASYLLDYKQYPDSNLYLDYSITENRALYPVLTTSDCIYDFLDTVYKFRHTDLYCGYPCSNHDILKLQDILEHPYHIEFQEIKTINVFKASILDSNNGFVSYKLLNMLFRSEYTLRKFMDDISTDLYLQHNKHNFNFRIQIEEIPVTSLCETFLTSNKGSM